MTTSARQGYSGKALSAKLGLRNGMKVALIGLPAEVAPLVSDVWPSLVEVPIAEVEHVHIFTVDGYVVKDLASVLRKQFTNSEVLCISWPKKSSGVVTDITEITEDHLRGVDIAIRVGGCKGLCGGCDMVCAKIHVA